MLPVFREHDLILLWKAITLKYAIETRALFNGVPPSKI
jgi:hypothetical protein